MRKLATTAFALSLVALGCGSDEGTPAKTDAAPKTDTPVLSPDSPVLSPDSPVLGPDSPVLGPDSPVLGPDAEVPEDVVGTPVDTGKTDATPVVDSGAPDHYDFDLPRVSFDAQSPETGDRPSQPIDGGADGQAGEAAAPIDGGVVDGGVVDGGTIEAGV
jgi:hypothetical protein